MVLSVELAFDQDSERWIERISETVAEGCGVASPRNRGIRPHISLAVFSDVELPFLPEAVARLASQVEAFTLRLATVGFFATAEGVIYLAPRPSQLLHQLHHDLHDVIAAHGVRSEPYYQPSRWVPHCTVATGVRAEHRDAAMGCCQAAEEHGDVTAAAMQIMSYFPPRELYCQGLGRRGSENYPLQLTATRVRGV